MKVSTVDKPCGVFLACALWLCAVPSDGGDLYTFVRKWPDWHLGHAFDVAVDAAGNLYVADTLNDRVKRFTREGAFIREWGGFGDGDGELAWPNGVAVDAGETVYVADSYNGRIQKFTSAGDFVGKWGSHGPDEDQLDYPRGVAVDTTGTVYVSDGSWDAECGRLLRFTSDGGWLPWSAPGRLLRPNSLALEIQPKSGFGVP